MTVIARDQVASDHLVYAWPFPIGPECEVSCSNDEQVVMCPAWMVGDRLGPGRHRWRTPDPTRPVGAFFVLTAPVDVAFDLVTSFMIPNTGQPVRLRASGSLQVRCADPGLLIAQFVGLPFQSVNEGVMRSVSRSLERMLARLLTRRVVMSQTPVAVTDAGMLPGIIDELIAYNPTAGAVFGVELIRIGRLIIAADDGSTPYLPLPVRNPDWSGGFRVAPEHANGNGHHHAAYPPSEAPTPPRQYPRAHTPSLDTIRGMPAVNLDPLTVSTQDSVPPVEVERPTDRGLAVASGEIILKPPPVTPATQPAVSGEIGTRKTPPMSQTAASGEIRPRTQQPTVPGLAVSPTPPSIPAIPSVPRRAHAIDVPKPVDEITPTPTPPISAPAEEPEARGSIMGIGMGAIGGSVMHGEIPTKVPPGGRVLIAGPNGLMQSATVRQLLSGYYELEVGSTGETIWMPMAGVVPE